MSLRCLAGESIRAERWFSARPLFRKRAGRSSNACVVPVYRPRGHGSTSGFPRAFIAAGNWRRKWAEVWACFFGRSRRDGSPCGPTYDCWSHRGREARGKPDGCSIEVLYRRGGLGGSTQAWEIDHAAGLVRLVPEVANPASCEAQRPELDRSELVLFAGQNQRPSITVCSPKAERLGLHIGQPLAEAKALLPESGLPSRGCRRRPRRPLSTGDRLPAILATGRSGRGRSSRIAASATSPVARISGMERNQFLQAVRGYWRKRGYHIQLALAATMGAAWALAHTAATSLVPAGDERSGALSGLPVAALRLPPAALERLEALGLYDDWRCAATAARDAGQPVRRDLAAAAGPGAWACCPKPSSASGSRSRCRSLREWEVPIDDRFAWLSLCRQMLRELLSMAERHGMGLQELEGEIRTETGPVTIEIRLVEPTRDERHLAQLVELQLERRTWSGGVVAVRWTALRLGRAEQAQGSWFGDDAADEIITGIQHPDRSTQQPPGGQGRAASGNPSRLAARARSPARPVDERGTTEDRHVHVAPGTVSRPSVPAPGQSLSPSM